MGDRYTDHLNALNNTTLANATISTTPSGTQTIAFADGGISDAFGRFRVSNPVTLFDSKQLYDKAPLFWDEETSGGGETSVHSTVNAATTMTVAAASGEYVIRQTFMRTNYQPGKSQQILFTFNMGAGTANVQKRIGYFNTSTTPPYTANIDGIFLEQEGTTLNIVQSQNGSREAVPQSSWNVDPFDGTGPSQVTLDISKAQILIMDFEWLGVGRVRVGFIIDGKIYYAHYFNNANTKETVYMSSPNHSVRYEIRSMGGTDSMDHNCSSVTSEGGENQVGHLHYVSTGGTHLDAATENTDYALILLRLKESNIDSVTKLVGKNVALHTASSFAEWKLIFNPAVDSSGTLTWNNVDNSSMQYALGGTAHTVTGGETVDGGFFESGDGGMGASAGGSTGVTSVNALTLGAGISGVRDTWGLVVRPIGGSSAIDVEGSIQWRELV